MLRERCISSKCSPSLIPGIPLARVPCSRRVHLRVSSISHSSPLRRAYWSNCCPGMPLRESTPLSLPLCRAYWKKVDAEDGSSPLQIGVQLANSSQRVGDAGFRCGLCQPLCPFVLSPSSASSAIRMRTKCVNPAAITVPRPSSSLQPSPARGDEEEE
jgi:hypothetical protein